jgi:hypothetical protein
MSTDTEELIRICEALPEAKRVEVADFARFLLAQEGDRRWEQIISDPRRRPKLDEFLKASKAEVPLCGGGFEQLDADDMPY